MSTVITPATRTTYKWYVAWLLCGIAIINYADRAAISSVFPLLQAEFGMSDIALGALGSFFLWSYAAASPLAGFLADRFSRTRIIVWSLGLWSVVTALTGIVRTGNELLAVRLLLGLTEAAYIPAALALLADHHKNETRATANGIHGAGLNFGLVVGGTLAGFVGQHFGWRLSFFILGAVGLAVCLLAHVTLRDASAPASPQEGTSSPGKLSALETVLTVVRVPTYLLLAGSTMVVAIGIWIFFNWLPLYFKETYNLSLAAAGFSGTFLLQVAQTGGALAGGYTSDRVTGGSPERRLVLTFLCFFASAPFLLAFLGRLPLAAVGSCIFLFALLRSFGSVNEVTIVCELLPANVRSTALALMNTMNCFAGGIGVIMAGYLKSYFGLGGVFAGVSLIMLVAGVLVLISHRFFIRKDLLRLGTAPAVRHAL